MLRFGIITRHDLTRYDWTSSRRIEPPISCTLLADLDDPTSEIEDLAIDAFFAQTSNGPHYCKRTWRHRYQSLDREVVRELQEIFPANARVRVHDMAASSAITSLEFFQALAPWNDVELHASDYYDAALVVALRNGWKVAFDADRRPWQFIGRRMIISAGRPERKRYPVNRLLKWVLTARVLPQAVAALEADTNVVRIPLFHPKAIALARRDRRFSLGRHNVTEPTDESYEVVRMMMILSAQTLGRFLSDDHIARALQIAGRSVVEGGLFVAGLNHMTTGLSATIFQRRSNRFIARRDFSGGYEHRDIVLQLDLADERASAMLSHRLTHANRHIRRLAE